MKICSACCSYNVATVALRFYKSKKCFAPSNSRFLKWPKCVREQKVFTLTPVKRCAPDKKLKFLNTNGAGFCKGHGTLSQLQFAIVSLLLCAIFVAKLGGGKGGLVAECAIYLCSSASLFAVVFNFLFVSHLCFFCAVFRFLRRFLIASIHRITLANVRLELDLWKRKLGLNSAILFKVISCTSRNYHRFAQPLHYNAELLLYTVWLCFVSFWVSWSFANFLSSP